MIQPRYKLVEKYYNIFEKEIFGCPKKQYLLKMLFSLNLFIFYSFTLS